jgi:hypothetical protein
VGYPFNQNPHKFAVENDTKEITMDKKGMGDGTGKENGATKDAFSLRSGKITVGPSSKGFDQGSAYDAMNSEETGLDGPKGVENYGNGEKM